MTALRDMQIRILHFFALIALFQGYSTETLAQGDFQQSLDKENRRNEPDVQQMLLFNTTVQRPIYQPDTVQWILTERETSPEWSALEQQLNTVQGGRNNQDSVLIASLRNALKDIRLEVYARDSVAFDQAEQSFETIRDSLNNANSRFYSDTSLVSLFQDTTLFRLVIRQHRQTDSIMISELRDGQTRLRRSIDRFNAGLIEFRRNAPFSDSTLNELRTSANNSIVFCNALVSRARVGRAAFNEVVTYNRRVRDSLRAVAQNNASATTELDNLISVFVPLTSAQIVPNINIKGSARTRIGRDEKQFVDFNMQLFLGALNTTFSDTTQRVKVYEKLSKNLWIPEISNFGLRATVSGNLGDLNNLEKSKLGYMVQGNFLSKPIPTLDDSLKINGTKNANFLHVKAGLESVFFSNILNLYGQLNYLTPIDQIKTVNAFFETKDVPAWWFVNFGMVALLNLNDSKQGNKILLGLDFVLNSPELQKVTRNTDLAITTIRLTFVPNLNVGRK